MRRLLQHPLARGASWMTAAQVARLGAQAVMFVLVARAVGVTGLGQLAAALAVVFLAVPFAGLGGGNLLVLRASRDPAELPHAWSCALGSLAISAAVLVPAAVGAGVALLGLPLALLLTLAISELVFGKLADLAGQAFQAQERIREMAALALVTPVLRAGAAIAFSLAVSNPSATAWAWWYLAGGVAGAGVSLAVVRRRLATPWRPIAPSIARARQGLLFSLTHSASLLTADADKVLLARLDTLGAVGIYTAAYRMVTYALVPVTALLAASYARFFRHGHAGVGAALAFARRLLPGTLAYGALAGGVLFALAPLVPLVLGDGYAESVDAVRWLAPLPILTASLYLAADTLTGADRQGLRTALQAAAAGLSIGLAAALIPAYSWRGAAWATLAGYAVLSASLWIAVLVSARGEVRARTTELQGAA